MADRIQIRRDLAAEWTSVNPILAQGEFGFELDSIRFKIGNAVTAWNDLPYLFDYPWGLRIVLTGDDDWVLPQHFMLTNFVVIPTAGINLKVGSTAGGEEYFPELAITTAGYVYSLGLYADVDKDIFFGGITSSTAIILFFRYVKQS